MFLLWIQLNPCFKFLSLCHRLNVCVLVASWLLSLCLFACVFPFFSFFFPFCFCFVYVVHVHPADVHVGEPRPGIRGEEGGDGPPAAARTSGRGQCGLCRPRHGGDVHVPLATGALRVPVWPTCLVQHRGRTRRRPRRTRTPEQTTGKSAEHQPLTWHCYGNRDAPIYRLSVGIADMDGVDWYEVGLADAR